MRYVLVTGSNGMLGQQVVRSLVDAGYNVAGISLKREPLYKHEKYLYFSLDLTKCLDVEKIFQEYEITHIIHLAAIAHTYRGMDASWSRYYRINTMCSKTLFKCADERNIPVFFASTIDVYGLTGAEVTEDTQPRPVGFYARSKHLAEEYLKKLGIPYAIARFAPIYSDGDRKDIQKRLFLKYPSICYKMDKEYEFLSTNKAVDIVLRWVDKPEQIKGIFNVKDEERHKSRDLILAEKSMGHASLVIHIPLLVVRLLEKTAAVLLKNNAMLSFKANKLLKPIRTDNKKIEACIEG